MSKVSWLGPLVRDGAKATGRRGLRRGVADVDKWEDDPLSGTGL
jgi:hypothetical protein